MYCKICHCHLTSLLRRMLMPDLNPEDQFALLQDGRLYLKELGIFLASNPRQYCIEEVLDAGLSGSQILSLKTMLCCQQAYWGMEDARQCPTKNGANCDLVIGSKIGNCPKTQLE